MKDSSQIDKCPTCGDMPELARAIAAQGDRVKVIIQRLNYIVGRVEI